MVSKSITRKEYWVVLVQSTEYYQPIRSSCYEKGGGQSVVRWPSSALNIYLTVISPLVCFVTLTPPPPLPPLTLYIVLVPAYCSSIQLNQILIYISTPHVYGLLFYHCYCCIECKQPLASECMQQEETECEACREGGKGRELDSLAPPPIYRE